MPALWVWLLVAWLIYAVGVLGGTYASSRRSEDDE
jgi:uncharacterized protein YneF (UPF0154 family)